MSTSASARKSTEPEYKFPKPSDCPDAAWHTPSPRGYANRAEWLMHMLETHKQKRCPTCRYWMVWGPRKPSKCEAVIIDGVRVCAYCGEPMEPDR